MTWVKGIVGVVCMAVGLGWVGQGVGIFPGSFMSGQIQWAVIGLVLVGIGGWLLWSLIRALRSLSAPRG